MSSYYEYEEDLGSYYEYTEDYEDEEESLSLSEGRTSNRQECCTRDKLSCSRGTQEGIWMSIWMPCCAFLLVFWITILVVFLGQGDNLSMVIGSCRCPHLHESNTTVNTCDVVTEQGIPCIIYKDRDCGEEYMSPYQVCQYNYECISDKCKQKKKLEMIIIFVMIAVFGASLVASGILVLIIILDVILNK